MVDKRRRQLTMTALSLMGISACRPTGMADLRGDGLKRANVAKSSNKFNRHSQLPDGAHIGKDDWEVPVINSVSGTFSQANIMTLTGAFSAKRSGQMYYHTGDPEKDGELAEFLEDFGGGDSAAKHEGRAYRHDSTRAFSKNGAAFHTNLEDHQQSGIGNQCFFFPDSPQKEIFVSVEYWLGLNVLDLSKIAQPQVKFVRLLSGVGKHHSFPELISQQQYMTSHTASGDGGRMLLAYAGAGPYGNRFIEPDGSATWGRGDTFAMSQNWNRQMILWRQPSAAGMSDGRRWGRTIEHAGNRQIPTRDQSTWTYGGNPPANPLSFYAPKAVSDDNQNDPAWQGMITRVTMPFYQLGYPNLDIWIDCIYINDSAERVELGNAPTMESCTKLVVQKQIFRADGRIEFEVEEGNLTGTDDVYVFVVNSNTRYTAGTRIR